jgi:hypothetical protein
MQGNSCGEGFADRLDQHSVQIQLAEQLPQHRPCMVFAGGVAGLAVAIRLRRSSLLRRSSSTPRPEQRSRASPGQWRRSRPEAIRRSAGGRGLDRAPQRLAGADHWSRSAAPPGIWGIVQSRIAAQGAPTTTC